MRAFTLPSGAIFQSFWGGQPRKAITLPDGRHVGEHSTVRIYHELTPISCGGIQWIKCYKQDDNHAHAGDRWAHCVWLSTCGHYKIVRYRDARDAPYFLAYAACTWRKDMQSTFGNYIPSLGNRQFPSFEVAAEAVASAKEVSK